MSAGADTLKSVLFALGANTSIAFAKLFAALYTGSGAMMAEAIHSAADAGNQLLLILGLKKARKAPDEEHSLGYGKAIYFWSFIVALVLFSLGGLFSIYEGWHKLHSPEPLDNIWVAVAVLIFAIVAESISMWGCLREVNKVLHGRSYWRWFRESRQSELLVVFGEDLAALIGLCLALAAILISELTGNPAWDAMGSISIGVLLVVVAIFIGIEIKALLIGQSADVVTRQQMQTWLEDRQEVNELYSLLTMQMGPDILVAVKARMAETQSAENLLAQVNQVEKSFRENFPDVMWLFFEPDNKP